MANVGKGDTAPALDSSLAPFVTLITAVYWHLAAAAAGKRPHIECQWSRCGKWMQQQHGHQRYCPPQEEGKESRCSLKARQERFKELAKVNGNPN